MFICLSMRFAFMDVVILACSIQNYESEKELVYDSVKADLDEKILRLEEDKNNVDINNGLWELSARRNRKRQVIFISIYFLYGVYIFQSSEISPRSPQGVDFFSSITCDKEYFKCNHTAQCFHLKVIACPSDHQRPDKQVLAKPS